MIYVNGIPLENRAQGWWLVDGSTPRLSQKMELTKTRSAGRDGVRVTGSVRGPGEFRLKLHVEHHAREALFSVFSAPTLVVTDSELPGWEARGTLTGSSLSNHYDYLGHDEELFVVEVPSGCWRAVDAFSPVVSASASGATVSVFPGLSAPVQDAIVRLRGPLVDAQVRDASGSFFTLDGALPENTFLRFEAATGRAFHTLTDTWTGGTEISGLVDFGGPRGVFEVTPQIGEPVPEVVATNYAPPIVQGSAWTEVRRNLWPDPLFTNPGALTKLRATATSVDGVLTVTRTQTGGAARAQTILNMSAAPVGVPVVFSAIRTLPAPINDVGYLLLDWFDEALTTSYGSATSQIDTTTLGEQLHEVVLARPHADATQLSVRFEAGSGLGNVVEWRKPLVEIGARPRAWYAPGVIEGVEQPGDFRARFTGTEHNSPMVLEGQAVAGYSGTRVAVVYSQKAGKPAIRLCPTGTDVANSFAFFTVPSALRAGGTALATRHLDAPLTGVLDPRAGRLLVVTPDAASDQAPNTAGSRELRTPYGVLTGAYQVRLYHGGLAGSGDVWWTEPALCGPGYGGGYFDISTQPADGYTYRYQSGGSGPVEKVYTAPPSPALREGRLRLTQTGYGPGAGMQVRGRSAHLM